MTVLSPTQRAVLRTLGEDGVSGTVAVPANQDYVIFLTCPFPCNVTGLETQLTAGTLTANLKVGGVSVAGMSAIAVTTALLRTNPTVGSTTVQVQQSQLLSITVTAVAGAANFSYVFFYTRPPV